MLRVLQLSDPHFGKNPGPPPHSSHFFERNGEPLPERLAEVLGRDDLLKTAPDIIVVSGDVAWSASSDDYKYALVFFRKLRDMWPGVKIIVAPGNHDASWTVSPGRQDAFVEFLRSLHGKDFARQYPFVGAAGSVDRHMLVAFETAESGTDKMAIVAVNSAAYLDGKSVPVHVSEQTLIRIEEHLAAIKPEGLRLFVVHHHLLPFAEPHRGSTMDPAQPTDYADPTIVANSAKLQQWLATNEFHVVLHGHKHQSHGREDILWRREDHGETQRLFVIGAGSAGVEAEERSHAEPLSYNVIAASRISGSRWNVSVQVRHIPEAEAVMSPKPLFRYRSITGKPLSGAPATFHAERMDDCHRAIRDECAGGGLLRNFVSIVETAKYFHPTTARIDSDTVTAAQVESSFRALHPEYEPTDQWQSLDRVEHVLREISPRFQFQHGPRLFGSVGGVVSRSDAKSTRPIVRAVQKLQWKAASHAVVSLFTPDIDILSRKDEPLPALQGIQFVSEDRKLDIFATFRKIELSFWWVVNMYEMIQLLHWAANEGKEKFEPRRITFYAALAEWKKEPEPAFVTQLDSISLKELSETVASCHAGNGNAREKLRRLLHEKIEHTNENNLDAAGLSRLADLLDGLKPSKKIKNVTEIQPQASAKIRDAVRLINAATERATGERSAETKKARLELGEAIAGIPPKK
jgi:predicted phosphohydrolase